MGLETAAILGIASLAVGVGSTGVSFAQASKAQDIANQADLEAARKMNEINQELEVNRAEALPIQKRAYDDAVEDILAFSSGVTESIKEGDPRGSAGAGKVLGAFNKARMNIARNREQDLARRQEKIVQEDIRKGDIGIQLDMLTVQANEAKAANYADIADKAMMEGVQGVAGVVQQGIGMAPLFAKGSSKTQKAALDTIDTTTPEGSKVFEGVKLPGGDEFTSFGALTNKEFREFKRDLQKYNPQQYNQIFGRSQYEAALQGQVSAISKAFQDAANPFTIGAGGLGGLDLENLTDAQKQMLIVQLTK